MKIIQSFLNACTRGNLPLAQEIYAKNPTINISKYNEHVFRAACRPGHLHVAQWLLCVKPTIDISAKNEEAFRYACSNGHLEVAQWLLSVKPTIDISANDEEAFGRASLFLFRDETCHLKVVQWLVSLKPFLYTMHTNADTGEMTTRVRVAEQARWQTRKYVMWMRTSEQKNTTVFQKIPQDVSRYIVQMYL